MVLNLVGSECVRGTQAGGEGSALGATDGAGRAEVYAEVLGVQSHSGP